MLLRMKNFIALAVCAFLVTGCMGESCLKYLLSDGDFPNFVDCFIDDVADAVSAYESEIPEGHVRDPFAPDGMTVPKIIEKEGLRAEQHNVTTKDGYKLTMHRIPNKEGSTPVFLQHGFAASSLDWVLGGKKRGALAFLLHERGYDVWMGNARGNLYSKEHEYMTSDDPDYWDYSWEEMGLYDIPAELEYIKKTTNKKIIYVGYSMGSTMSYVMASERPDIAKHLKAMYSISPVVYMSSVRTFVSAFAPSYKGIMEIMKYFGVLGFHTLSLPARSVFHFACNYFGLGFNGCIRVMDGIIGISAHQLNWEDLWAIESHVPTGISARTATHYAQNMNWGRFAKYDHGSKRNQEMYKSDSPPDFDLTKVDVPVGLIWADNDVFADPADIAVLRSKLPNIILNHNVTNNRFNHVDFMYSKNAPKEVFHPLIESIEKVEQQFRED